MIVQAWGCGQFVGDGGGVSDCKTAVHHYEFFIFTK